MAAAYAAHKGREMQSTGTTPGGDMRRVAPRNANVSAWSCSEPQRPKPFFMVRTVEVRPDRPPTATWLRFLSPVFETFWMDGSAKCRLPIFLIFLL